MDAILAGGVVARAWSGYLAVLVRQVHMLASSSLARPERLLCQVLQAKERPACQAHACAVRCKGHAVPETMHGRSITALSHRCMFVSCCQWDHACIDACRPMMLRGGTGSVWADVVLAMQCGQRSDFFIIYSNGVQLDFVAFGVTLVRSAARLLQACHSVWQAQL